jgi:ankyrin repeat protein
LIDELTDCRTIFEGSGVLLEKDSIDLNPKDNDGRTALSLSIGEGHEPIVRLLLGKDGIDPYSG